MCCRPFLHLHLQLMVLCRQGRAAGEQRRDARPHLPAAGAQVLLQVEAAAPGEVHLPVARVRGPAHGLLHVPSALHHVPAAAVVRLLGLPGYRRDGMALRPPCACSGDACVAGHPRALHHVPAAAVVRLLGLPGWGREGMAGRLPCACSGHDCVAVHVHARALHNVPAAAHNSLAGQGRQDFSRTSHVRVYLCMRWCAALSFLTRGRTGSASALWLSSPRLRSKTGALREVLRRRSVSSMRNSASRLVPAARENDWVP
jgi:hypothetical protein